MTMTLSPRHTRIIETVVTPFGTLVHEDCYQYPRHESNLYMVDAQGNVLWFAERAVDDDAYANRIRKSSDATVKCASWNGFDCEIDLKTGALVHASFAK